MNPSIGTDRVRNAVKTVNGIAPDVSGEITTINYVQTINNNPPDIAGNATVVDTITGISSNNTVTVGPGGLPGEYDFQARVSSNAGNGVSAVSDGLYMSKLASDLEVTPYGSFPSATNVQTALQQLSDSAIATATDTDTINFSTSPGTITGNVKIDPALDNLLTESVAGLKASNSAIDIKTGSLTGYGFDAGVTDTRGALIFLGQNRVISQPVDGVGVPTSPFLADSSIHWRTGAMVNEYMQKFTNPYGIPGYPSEFGLVANANLGSGIALTFAQDGTDTTRSTLWIDSAGKLRIKSGALPTTDTAGVIVGTQS